ncbi:MAG: protein-glutamate O-methyltransferase CheR [Planctomycetota bacterium]|nr:protein-glutamate O-methyltransferase CheR [Planctomycetota bacterium]
MTTAALSMSPKEFADLRAIIYERSGIHFQESKKYVLESRLARRVEELGMNSFDQYVKLLSMGPFQQDEFQEMFNRITINETSFFRNEPQLQVFETVCLSKLLEDRKSTRRLRIWSAACSTGEEPYTLAMQVHRSLGVRLADWHVEILGTDISERCLLAAQRARYTAFSFRSVNPLLIKRYFREENGEYILDPTIQSMVNFELHNLKDVLAARRHGTWDVIFCRNVMIYFDDDMKTRVVKMFHDQLASDGYLFIGHSETLRNIPVGFSPMNLPQSFAYTKGPQEP